MSLSDIITTLSIWGDTLEPEIKTSKNYKHWVSVEDLKRCIICKEKGWKPSKWPTNFIETQLITGGIYNNDDGHLPIKNGRIWYEADINYKTGKRNNQRIVWSNDGLVFVTYDHYETFYEII